MDAGTNTSGERKRGVIFRHAVRLLCIECVRRGVPRPSGERLKAMSFMELASEYARIVNTPPVSSSSPSSTPEMLFDDEVTD